MAYFFSAASLFTSGAMPSLSCDLNPLYSPSAASNGTGQWNEFARNSLRAEVVCASSVHRLGCALGFILKRRGWRIKFLSRSAFKCLKMQDLQIS
jgi:hypothetical protein